MLEVTVAFLGGPFDSVIVEIEPLPYRNGKLAPLNHDIANFFRRNGTSFYELDPRSETYWWVENENL